MPAPPPPTVIAAAFVAEARDAAHLPPAGPPEIAIAGRSNVGKSTLLNRMAGRHGLARVSKTPGRTRGLVLFDLEVRWPNERRQGLRLVDLPGYGYAKVSRDERRAWQALVEGYVGRRDTLKLVLLLVDARRELGAEETQLLAWLEANQVPCLLVITKADKLGAAACASACASRVAWPWSRARPARAWMGCGAASPTPSPAKVRPLRAERGGASCRRKTPTNSRSRPAPRTISMT
jgi:GTP-binding protein